MDDQRSTSGQLRGGSPDGDRTNKLITHTHTRIHPPPPPPTCWSKILNNADAAPGLLGSHALGRPHPGHAILLVLAQPRLLGLAKDREVGKIQAQAEDDHGEGERVEAVKVISEDPDANRDAVEIAGQQADVEEGGRRQAQQHGHGRVEDEHDEGEAGLVAAHRGRPVGVAERLAVKDGGLHARDEHAPHADLADNLVQRRGRDQELLGHVAEAVETRAQQHEEVALELGGDAAAHAAAVLGVAGEKQAHAAAADQDADDLGPVVAHAQEGEGQDDDGDDGPEVDQLGGDDGGVAEGEHDKVISLDVEEREDKVLPGPGAQHLPIALGANLVERVGRVDDVEQHVVEEQLEGGD